MPGETDTDIQKQILKSLREFYPIKVDDIVLVAAVQKNVKDASVEQINKDIASMKEKGWIEETIVKAPFGKAETYRYKITSAGIEHLQAMEEKEVKFALPAKEIESRLVETYDRIKADMEQMRQNLETSQKTLEKEMAGVRERIADHDTVIRTYFVRVIETFGVFVGIFAVSVVLMVGGINQWTSDTSSAFWQFLIGVPTVLIVVILTLLYGIKKFIMWTPKN
jgi:DNA-binding PadR family transcriptional regulator